MFRHHSLIWATGLLAIGLGSAQAADEASVAFFKEQVKPLLEAKCFKCHGVEKVRGGLNLTHRQAVIDGGDLGPAVNLKDPGSSLLLKMISYTDDEHQMPPKGKLPQEEIDILTRWVMGGVAWTPGEEVVAEKKHTGFVIDDAARNYWAYQPASSAAVPAVQGKKWIRNPIDSFVLQQLEAKGLKPNPEADRLTLIRRATYDLTGLPPTLEEISDFVADRDPQAYEKLIDRLLASPHYGEKWGRHWLDLVRFAETNGYERDSDKPHAWRYRDYVIQSLNADKPYDQFLTEQLAGDEMPDSTAESITATGYFRLGIWDDEPADRELAMYDVLDGIVSTTSSVMLGMSIGCARCHDHKKDPITQKDYYSLLSFFHNITPMGKEGANIERAVRDDPAAQAARTRRMTELETSIAEIEAEFRQKLAGAKNAAGGDLDHLGFRYYRDSWEALPVFDELKPETVGKLPGNLFDTSFTTREMHYGFVFEGELKVPQTGRYQFHFNADDGVRLILAGRKIFEWDGIHGFDPQDRTAGVDLEAGRIPVRLEYFQAHGGRGLKVSWSGPGIEGIRTLSSTSNDATLTELIDRRGDEVLGSGRHKHHQKLRKDLAALKQKPVGELALVVTERGPQAPETFLLVRGMPGAHGDRVQPAFPIVLGAPAPVIPARAPGAKTTGRRLALARWITSPDNALTSRTMANRLWQYHFGRGIVPTPNDFGQLGEQPLNQPLLDWLAKQLVAADWRLKAMHKLIMTSSTYRLASTDDPAGLAKDPSNLLHWRFPARRLTAEEIRDSVLAVNGSLNRTMGGPSVYPPMPAAVLATSSTPDKAWGKSSPEDASRRSIYVKVKRSLRLPILESHDAADTDNSTATRFATTVPTQALIMINSEFMHEHAARFAAMLRKETGNNPADQVRRALNLVTGRPPAEADVRRGTELIRNLEAVSGGQAEDPLQRFCLVALNLNAFVTID